MGTWQPAVFDPILIVAQLVVMQCFFYIVLGFLLSVVCSMTGETIILEHVTNYEAIEPTSVAGALSCIAFFAAACIAGAFLRVTVGKAKKCLDFAASLHILHFVVCWAAWSIPASVSWFIIAAISTILMSVIGEYLCLIEEMREIPRSRAVIAI
eukprot:c10267_g1_i1.p1 GENE.c10267_g1_i1~~c10267_g1_i1.p1  ORF type:complete len:154 (-),score=30.20 c10267_g1_i1:355-816(-)